jgi:hypothetical protein
MEDTAGERTNDPPTAAISNPEPGKGMGRKIRGRKIFHPIFLTRIFLTQCRFMDSHHGR